MTCDTLHVARNTSHVTHHTSHVTNHTSHVTNHTSHVTHHTSHVTCHTSHVTLHTSHVTRHTSHVTRHTSHVTHLTSHVTRHTSHVTHYTSHTIPGIGSTCARARTVKRVGCRSCPSQNLFPKPSNSETPKTKTKPETQNLKHTAAVARHRVQRHEEFDDKRAVLR